MSVTCCCVRAALPSWGGGGGVRRDFRYFQQQAGWCRFIPDVVYLTRSVSVFVVANLVILLIWSNIKGFLPERSRSFGYRPAPLGFFSSLVQSSLRLFVFRLSGGVTRCRGQSFGPGVRFWWSPPEDGSGSEELYFAELLRGDPGRVFLSGSGDPSPGMSSATARTWNAASANHAAGRHNSREASLYFGFSPVISRAACGGQLTGSGFDSAPGRAESGLAVAEEERKRFHHSPQHNAALCSRRQNGAAATMTAAFSPLLYFFSDHIHVPLRHGGLDNRQL